MNKCITKALRAFVLAMLVLLSTGLAYAAPAAAAIGEIPAETITASPVSTALAATNVFGFDVTAKLNGSNSSQIDLVISIKNIQQELDAVEFVLDFDQRFVSAVYTQNGDAMNVFMTKTPMYTFVVPGATSTEVQVSRYEQICSYDASNGSYVCRFADLLSYDYAKPGQSFSGLKKNGDLVITIPFKILDNVAVGTRIPFSITNVKGTTRPGLNSVGGSSASASYTTVAEEVPVVTPVINLKYPTLTFEDEIVLNVYYQTEGLEDVVQMGMLVYSKKVSSWNVFNAEKMVPGYTKNANNGFYVSATNGIPAKCLNDTVYFAVYALRSNGEYVYSKLVSYCPKTYAYNQLSTSDVKLKSLMVAMLNYGAAAQTFFNYNVNSLANADLTAAHKACVKSYSASMVNAVDTVNSNKVGIFTNTGGFARKYPTISFEGAFSINYYFTPSTNFTGTMRMYYWNEADYNKATKLTSSNATGCIIMENDGSGVYQAAVQGIAAKDLDGTIFIAAGYSLNGTAYCTGVLAYSIGSYCVSQANYASDLQPLAQATAVYGYYAKAFFYTV